MKRNTYTPEHPAQPTDAKKNHGCTRSCVPRKHSRGLNKMLQHPAAKRASSTIPVVRGGTGEESHDPPRGLEETNIPREAKTTST